jgi:hypothetical protein
MADEPFTPRAHHDRFLALGSDDARSRKVETAGEANWRRRARTQLGGPFAGADSGLPDENAGGSVNLGNSVSGSTARGGRLTLEHVPPKAMDTQTGLEFWPGSSGPQSLCKRVS